MEIKPHKKKVALVFSNVWSKVFSFSFRFHNGTKDTCSCNSFYNLSFWFAGAAQYSPMIPYARLSRTRMQNTPVVVASLFASD